MSPVRRVGIVGYGHIGQYLYDKIMKSDSLELDFVWNRSKEKLASIPQQYILDDLKRFTERDVDLIVEVSHVSITREYGQEFLRYCDFMIGSPTALAERDLETKLRHTATEAGHTLYVPAGAFWGGEDISKMADLGSLKALKVTMKKHSLSFKLLGELAKKNENVGATPCTLYDVLFKVEMMTTINLKREEHRVSIHVRNESSANRVGEILRTYMEANGFRNTMKMPYGYVEWYGTAHFNEISFKEMVNKSVPCGVTITVLTDNKGKEYYGGKLLWRKT